MKMDANGIAAFFGGLVALIVALTATFTVWNGRAMHRELKTMNSMSVGEMTDAATTDRYRAIPHDERTVAQQEHLDAAPPAEPPQGPSPTVAERTEAIYRAVNGKPTDQPSLYEMVQTLDMKVDQLAERFDRLEDRVGTPEVSL